MSNFGNGKKVSFSFSGTAKCGPLFEVILASANLPLISRCNQRR